MSLLSQDSCYNQALITVDEAISRLLQQAVAVNDTEQLPLMQALGRVLAENISSTIDVPGHDNTAMDGYAVRSADCRQSGARLRVSQRIPAGSSGQPLASGEAARIFTGAPIPPGADAVVMQERCVANEAAGEVVIEVAVAAGDNIRRAGEDIARGSTVLAAGTRLRQQELGLIASTGSASVSVHRRLRVACFFTGDELREPGEMLAPGQIYNSNRYTLNGFLQQHDCEVTDVGIVADDLEATVEVIERVAQHHDLILTSGGVSVGEEDYVRLALERLGEVGFWRIAMKPGKPVAFGKVGQALFLGLPGNPVSVFVTANIFALPLMRKLCGERDTSQPVFDVVADFDWPAVKRQEYLRARIEEVDGASRAVIYPQQGSGVLSSACWAEGLVEVPVDAAIARGDRVRFIPF